VIVRFIDAFRLMFPVLAIYRALSAHHVPVAPRTYWAARSRPPSRRALKDALVTRWLAAMFEPGTDGRRKPESLYGAVKARAHLNRHGLRVARCTVERLMRANGWRGSTRRRKARTTVPDPASPRCPDLVRRNFRAQAPGRLLVADFTYVPLVTGGYCYVAFVIDAFAGTIRGWEATLTKETAFVQRAIAQACARLRRLGHPVTLGAIHHSDAGSQYTSLRFARTLLLEGLAGSAGSAGTPWTTPWRKRPSGSARPSAPGTGRRSATARCAAAATWRRSPPPGCTGTTPSGSCTAPGSCPRPRPTPRTGPATPEPRLAAGLDMGPSRAATPGPQGQAG